jgi:hypothetical protein
MATVNLGSIKFKWKGTYSGATAYTVDDVVEYNGSSYICILASTGNLPTNATYFEQMSEKGADADLLSIASTVQGDLYYNNGGAIARLGAGTAGQVLQTGGAGANPSWSTLSSDVVRLSTIENQLATAIDLDLYSTTYNNYLHIVRMEQYNTAERVQIKIRQSGSTINNSNYRYTWGGSQINSGGSGNGQNGGAYSSPNSLFETSVWSSDGANHSKELRVWVSFPKNGANYYPYLQWEAWGSAPTEMQHIQGFGYYNVLGNWDGIRFFTAGGNTARWQITTYGYKHN